MATERLNVGWATGRTLKVEVIRLSDSFRLDWADGVFKVSGWTTRQQAMAEDGTTIGWYALSVVVTTWTNGDYLLVCTDTTLTTQPVSIRAITVVGGTTVGAAAVVVVSPVVSSVPLALVRGDDYLATDGRALEFVEATAAPWPDLTGASITFGAAARVGAAQSITATGSVLVPSGAGKRVRVELPTATTATLRVGSPAYDFDVQATIATRKVTLLRGVIFVLADYAA